METRFVRVCRQTWDGVFLGKYLYIVKFLEYMYCYAGQRFPYSRALSRKAARKTTKQTNARHAKNERGKGRENLGLRVLQKETTALGKPAATI